MMIRNNTQILIIDDVYDEVKSLMSVLAKNGLSYVYNDGSTKMKPSKKNRYVGVRFVILDINLIGVTQGLPDETKGAKLAELLASCISENNGPIFVLFCTNEENVVEAVKKNLLRTRLSLVGSLLLEKENGSVGTKALAELNKALDGADLPDSFNYFLSWEQNVDRARSLFIHELSTLSPPKDVKPQDRVKVWDTEMKRILSNLAIAYTGMEWKKIKNDPKIADYATSMLNQSFSDKIPKDGKTLNIPQENNFPNISIDALAKINTSLFLEEIIDNCKVDTGRVAYSQNDAMLQMIQKSVIRADRLSSIQVGLIYAVITPQCDLAHPRFLSLENPSPAKPTPWHRVIWGMEVEIEDEKYADIFQKGADYQKKLDYIDNLSLSDEEKMTLRKSVQNCKPDSVFITSPLLNARQKKCVWVFHFASVTTMPLKKKQKFDYQMSRELVFDLQSKLANHVNRLGNSMLEC